MKKWLTAILLVVGLSFAEPEYTNRQYYVWVDGATATNVLTYINNSGWFPIIVTNAATGELAPDKTATTKWADDVLLRVDGKFCFQRIPITLLDDLGVSMEDREAFLLAFNPDIEIVQADWFLVEE